MLSLLTNLIATSPPEIAKLKGLVESSLTKKILLEEIKRMTGSQLATDLSALIKMQNLVR